jgi:hypothetical protein
MNASANNGDQPLSGNSDVDLNADLGGPDSGGLLSDLSGADAFGSPTGAAPKRSNASIFILFGVVVIAGGALYAMRHIGMTGLPEFGEEIKINYPLERSEKKFEEDYQNLLNDLRAADEVVQVPISEVVMNPFTWKGEAEAAIPIPNQPRESDRELEISRVTEQRIRELSFTVGRLKFTGVMGNRVRSATVNGQLVRQGDRVADSLRIIEIRDREIDLVAIPFSHTLSSGETITITPDDTVYTLSLDSQTP